MKTFICFMIWKCLHLCPNQVENHRECRRQRNQTRPIIDQEPTPEITALIHLGGQSLTNDHLPTHVLVLISGNEVSLWVWRSGQTMAKCEVSGGFSCPKYNIGTHCLGDVLEVWGTCDSLSTGAILPGQDEGVGRASLHVVFVVWVEAQMKQSQTPLTVWASAEYGVV
jgi:hypothetical protein